MTQTIESNVTKLGFLRHPETHEKFLPFTHWSGVLGLDTHITDLVGGTLHQSTLVINGTTRTVYAPTVFADSGFYAPTTAGTAGQFLYRSLLVNDILHHLAFGRKQLSHISFLGRRGNRHTKQKKNYKEDFEIFHWTENFNC